MVNAAKPQETMRIVFLDRGTLRADIGLPALPFAHEMVEYDRTAPEDVVARLHGAQVAILNKVRMGESELAALPDLRMIAIAATGIDNLDEDACRRHGVRLANVRDYANVSVPEHTFSLILALQRGIPRYRQDVADGSWSRAGQFCMHTHPIRDLNGATIGIFGRGAHGAAVGRIAGAFGMRVLYADRKEASAPRDGYLPFDQVLAESDVVTLHCPLAAENRHMISAREFGLMRRRPILINVSRGPLIDEAALVDALQSGVIGGVGLDVLATEPPPQDMPLLALAGRPDVIITPHVAWASDQAMRALMGQVAKNITDFVMNGQEP